MKIQKINIRLEGLSDIMFDRFIDHSKDNRPPEQKFYLGKNNIVVLPAENIRSFLFSENPPAGCAKTFEGKKGKEYIRIGYGHVHINPVLIPFLDKDGDPIHFKSFNNEQFYIYLSSPRVKASSGSNTIKQEAKPRPVLKLPWALEFRIDLIKNNIIDETKLYNWFCSGGLQIGLGTYRPVFGRFVVTKWDVLDGEI